MPNPGQTDTKIAIVLMDIGGQLEFIAQVRYHDAIAPVEYSSSGSYGMLIMLIKQFPFMLQIALADYLAKSA